MNLDYAGAIAAQDERHDEERFLTGQRRQASEDKAQRAREQFELLRQREIQNARRAAGSCIYCGRRLNAIVRFAGTVHHRACRQFSE